MKLFSFLRRRRRPRPNWRTAQRICALIAEVLRRDGEEYSIEELAEMTGQSVRCTYEVVGWMERMNLAFGYYPEPVIPGRPMRKLYFLTEQACKWASDAMIHHDQEKR